MDVVARENEGGGGMAGGVPDDKFVSLLSINGEHGMAMTESEREQYWKDLSAISLSPSLPLFLPLLLARASQLPRFLSLSFSLSRSSSLSCSLTLAPTLTRRMQCRRECRNTSMG